MSRSALNTYHARTLPSIFVTCWVLYPVFSLTPAAVRTSSSAKKVGGKQEKKEK